MCEPRRGYYYLLLRTCGMWKWLLLIVGVVVRVLVRVRSGAIRLGCAIPISGTGREAGGTLLVVMLVIWVIEVKTMLSRLVQRLSLLLLRVRWVRCVRRVILLWATVDTFVLQVGGPTVIVSVVLVFRLSRTVNLVVLRTGIFRSMVPLHPSLGPLLMVMKLAPPEIDLSIPLLCLRIVVAVVLWANFLNALATMMATLLSGFGLTLVCLLVRCILVECYPLMMLWR